MKKILVTSALPYCNNVPHLGNIIGSTLSGDVYSRYKKQLGYDVLYICGTDDYGTTTEVKALQENTTCQEICNRYNKLHKEIYDWFDINFDVWGKTSTDTQTKITHEIFLNLYKNGFIEEKTSTQMYCSPCNRFLADRYLKGICYHAECNGKNNITNGDQCDSCQKFIDVNKIINPFCYICKSKPYLKETNHLYLKLGALAKQIEDYNFNNPMISLPDQVKCVVKSWLDMGLESRCITRDLSWGTPVPVIPDDPILSKYKGKVFYVWFDAPFGYYSILASNNNIKTNDWLTKNMTWVQSYSKDNIPFHTIMFPGSIIGSGLDLPSFTHICSTEYLLYEGQKFSKSNNIGIFGDQVKLISEKLGITSDYWRYYLIKIRPESHDSSFDWKDFITNVNGELVNNIGNFINRCVSLSSKFCNNVTNYKIDTNMNNDIQTIIKKYNDDFEKFKFKDAFNNCLMLSTYGNHYLQKEQPWILAKNPNTTIEVLTDILGKANFICYHLIKLLYPIMPTISTILQKVFIIHPTTILINKDEYKLPFKQLDIKDVRTILTEANIKSSL